MSGLLDDTIAAVSTAPGRAGIAVVRISGAGALEVARGLGIEGLAPRSPRLCAVRHPDGTPVDRALVTWFPGPASYTGEDVVEIGCHGGALVPALVVDAALAAGARGAEPGEFTRRAYLNGKLDLVQVEATADLIDAASAAHHRAALFQLEGGLSARVSAIRSGLIELQALLAYDIDFPEEDDGPVPRERVDALAARIETDLSALLRDAPEGERLREGALVVFAGLPNVGKSSVFNALLGSERAIVTEVPGTTRDAIEAGASIEGFPFRLVDTAGVRDTDEPVERIGIEVARRALAGADIVLLCVEAGREPGEAERRLADEAKGAGATVILARTKADVAASAGGDGVPVSVRIPDGLAELREALVEAAFSGLRSAREPALVTRRRQARALRSAAEELGHFRDMFGSGHPAEIASTHVQDAVIALETLIGVTDVDDVLDAIFRSFCVGK